MVNNGVKTYDVVGFLIAYDIVGLTYDIVCDGVGNIVGQSGKNSPQTYDVVGQTYDIVGFTYDVVGYYTILYTTAYTMS